MTFGVTRAPRHRTELAALTGAKTVTNVALRWVGPFLPTLERAFSASTGTLTGIMGVCELGGLSTAAAGGALDRGHERRVFLAGLGAVAVASVIALGGTTITFAISFGLLVLGVSNLTVAGHAWIGHRVPYAGRNRAIGAFETSWAIALLVGAPILAVLIEVFGWRGPYVALAAGAAIAAAGVQRMVAAGSPASAPSADRDGGRTIPVSAWLPIIGSALTASAGLGTFVVSGAWLDDAYGLSTGGLGVVAAAFGSIELVASTSVAGFGDRIGARRSMLTGLIVLVAGISIILRAGGSTALAIAGLLVLLGGFEFAFVSSLTLVTEAAPLARGRTIGIANALGTLARAGAVVASGQLYERFGMTGSLSLVGAATVAAGIAISASSR